MTNSTEDDQDEAPKGAMAKVVDFVKSWGPAIFAVLFIRTFVFEPFRIPSGSMVPTLLIGDHVAVSKFSYGIWVPATIVEIPFLDFLWVVPRYQLLELAKPQRGDIIVFRFPLEESTNYIKRIVAVPGDRIKVRDNKIFINGEEMKREYQDAYDFVDSTCRPIGTRRYVEDLAGLKHEVLTNKGLSSALSDFREVEVPEDQVFVMGDNRDFSEDSRRWGFVRADQIKGKAHLVWLSWDGCEGNFGSIRSDRFFRNLYTN
ncbi:MAG: signal peptidase I [Alphaproteobacteria bacterium]|nr:signal peptidase I [Alphaproteobacteria bacterium]